MPLEECRIFKAFKTGERVHVDDEVLWRSDGTSFEAEYYSYPQYKNGRMIGAVVTFLDITDRRKAERDIVYMSYHDALTGLYNRRFFEEELRRLDTARNLPISIILGDVNSLKLTNDVFGHAAGDLLLQKVAESIKKVCRADDIIARWGGDEFAIFLPETGRQEAERILTRVREQFAQEQVKAIRGSISLGCHTKTEENEDIAKILEIAEDRMYSEKTLHCNSIKNAAIETIIRTYHAGSPAEKQHSENVRDICRQIGEAMQLPQAELVKLQEAAFLHDIGKIALEDRHPECGQLTDQDQQETRQHPVIGYRILHSSVDTVDLAEPVLYHHERWDGSGYPKGLKGKAIPLLARIIAVADSYDLMTGGSADKEPMSREEAVRGILENAGAQFDPAIAAVLARLVLSKPVE